MRTPVTAEFSIQAALHGESSSGWIWCAHQENFPSRCLVEIKHGAKSVICEYREIDPFFEKTYNDVSADRGYAFLTGENPLVMSLWYRSALGIPGEGCCKLTLRRAGKWLGPIRAGAEHPDQMMRLATKLALFGIWLGVVSIVLGIFSIAGALKAWFIIPFLLLLVLLAIAFWITKGVDSRDSMIKS